jgi:hypothetical protein
MAPRRIRTFPTAEKSQSRSFLPPPKTPPMVSHQKVGRAPEADVGIHLETGRQRASRRSHGDQERDLRPLLVRRCTSAGRHFLNVRRLKRLAADGPVAAGDLIDLDPGDAAQVFTLH